MTRDKMIDRITELARMTYDADVPWPFAYKDSRGKVRANTDGINRYCRVQLDKNVNDWQRMDSHYMSKLIYAIEGMLNLSGEEVDDV